MIKFISVKDGVGINLAHITVVRKLMVETADENSVVWQISLTTGKHEYVKNADVSHSAREALEAMAAGRYKLDA